MTVTDFIELFPMFRSNLPSFYFVIVFKKKNTFNLDIKKNTPIKNMFWWVCVCRDIIFSLHPSKSKENTYIKKNEI